MKKTIKDVLAVDEAGKVHVEFWADDSVDDVVVKLTPDLALKAAEALLRAARAAMKETAR